MIHELKEVEFSGKSGDPAYLRYSSLPVASTQTFAQGEVIVDLDESHGVVGIEMLSTDPEEWEAVAQIGKVHGLRFGLLLEEARTK